MSIFGLIDRAITALDRLEPVARLATRVGQALSRRKRRQPEAPPPFPRPHQWNLNNPPTCPYCQREQTPANEFSPCPGPPLRTA